MKQSAKERRRRSDVRVCDPHARDDLWRQGGGGNGERGQSFGQWRIGRRVRHEIGNNRFGSGRSGEWQHFGLGQYQRLGFDGHDIGLSDVSDLDRQTLFGSLRCLGYCRWFGLRAGNGSIGPGCRTCISRSQAICHERPMRKRAIVRACGRIKPRCLNAFCRFRQNRPAERLSVPRVRCGPFAGAWVRLRHGFICGCSGLRIGFCGECPGRDCRRTDCFSWVCVCGVRRRSTHRRRICCLNICWSGDRRGLRGGARKDAADAGLLRRF